MVFAKNGYNVVIAARNPEKLAATEAELSRLTGAEQAVSAVPTDITDESAVTRLVEEVAGRYETINVLINCAGAYRGVRERPIDKVVALPMAHLHVLYEAGAPLFPTAAVHAGVCLNGSVKDTSLADYIDQMNANFLGAVAMTKGARQDESLAGPSRALYPLPFCTFSAFYPWPLCRNQDDFDANGFRANRNMPLVYLASQAFRMCC
jgi:NAD(P)-dependent dehydrogenase (short-subunit alcohol dehydrogenase family)